MKVFTKLELVSYASEWWRLWSVRLIGAGTILTGWLIGSPDALLAAWNALPDAVKAMIPAQYTPFISLTLVVAGLLSQFVKQHKVIAIVEEKKIENGKTE